MRKFTNLMRFLTVVSLSLILVVGYAQKGKSPLSTKAPQQGQVYQPSTAATAGQSMTIGQPEDVLKAKQSVVTLNELWSNVQVVPEKPISSEPYDPSKYPVPDQGGETVATATVIGSLPYSDAGTTSGYLNDYDEACPYTGSTSPDVCYSYTPGASGSINIDLCGSSYDTKVFVYENTVTAGAPYACNDDYYFSAPCYVYSSAILGMAVTGGNTYYIIIDGYGGSSGNYLLEVEDAVPCIVTCPPGGIAEGEGDILNEGVDNFNGGCNSTPNVFSPIANNQTICGNWNTYTVAGADNRDTDWYLLDLSGATQPQIVTWTVTGEFPTAAFILTGICPPSTLGSATAAPCDPAVASATVAPGIYYLFAGGSVYNGFPAGGDWDYTASLSYEPASGGSGCENLSAYGTATVDPTGLVTTISTCSYAEEYSTINGVVAGETYQFTMSDLGTGAYITITDAPGNAGNILAYGPSPLNYVSAITGTLYAHWTLNEFCATDQSCHTTTVQCTSCVEPCNIECPIGGIAENEPDILDEGLDVTNGGCNSTPNVFSTIADGQTVCGNFNTYLYAGSQYRDTDWYELDLSGATGNTIITWTVTAEFPSAALIIGGPCPGSVLTSATANPCQPATATYVVAPGVYWLFASATVYTGYPAGGDWDYTGTVTLAPGPVSPPNDLCENAELVTGPYPQTVTGTLVGATIDCPGVLDWNAVWYEVTLPYATNTLNIDFCGTVGSGGQSFGIVYYDECGMCSNYIIGTYDFTTCPDGNNINIVWENVVGPGTILFPAYISAAIPFTATFNVTQGPVANITPASFEEYAAPGGSTTNILNVGNTGGSNLNYTATVNYGAKATATCYPQNLDYWTGTTTTAAKTQVSQINIFAGSAQGWAQFDVSSIPVGATVTGITLNWYVNTANCPYQYINALSVDPVTTDAATLYSAITGGALYTNYSQCPPIGWNTVTLGGNANADLTAALASGKFGVSFYEYEASTYYWTADGWAEVNKPYITVTYTTDPLWLTIDGAQTATGSVVGGGSQPYTIGFDATSLSAGTYTGDITFTTNEPGAKATYVVPVTFYVGYSVSGNVYYGTTGTTKPMQTNTTVTLTGAGLTVPTFAGGAYLIRPVANGSYTLTGATTKAAGGIQSADALTVQRYLLGSLSLTNLQKRAADVNNSNTVTTSDPLAIKRKVLVPSFVFAAPAYVFDGPFGTPPVQAGIPISVAGANVTQELRTLCAGDVNGSFTPAP